MTVQYCWIIWSLSRRRSIIARRRTWGRRWLATFFTLRRRFSFLSGSILLLFFLSLLCSLFTTLLLSHFLSLSFSLSLSLTIFYLFSLILIIFSSASSQILSLHFLFLLFFYQFSFMIFTITLASFVLLAFLIWLLNADCDPETIDLSIIHTHFSILCILECIVVNNCIVFNSP